MRLGARGSAVIMVFCVCLGCSVVKPCRSKETNKIRLVFGLRMFVCSSKNNAFMNHVVGVRSAVLSLIWLLSSRLPIVR